MAHRHSFVDGGGEGNGRENAAEFFRDDAEFELPGARAAVLFGDGDADQPEVCQSLPERLVVIAAVLEHGAGTLRTMFLEKSSRLIAQLLLLRREVEIHADIRAFP